MYVGLYVIRSQVTGKIQAAMTAFDSFEQVMEPAEYIERGVKPDIESLPDKATYDAAEAERDAARAAARAAAKAAEAAAQAAWEAEQAAKSASVEA
jgi:hypothetical protein